MYDKNVEVGGNITCPCGERPALCFRGELRQAADGWVVLVPTNQHRTCPCGREYRPDSPEVDLAVTYRAPIRKGVEVTAWVRLLETNGGD